MTLRELYNKFHATYDLHMASTCDAKPVVLMFDVKEKKKKNPRGNTGVTEFSLHVHFLKLFFSFFNRKYGKNKKYFTISRRACWRVT